MLGFVIKWGDLGAAIALYLVFEGLVPFLFPQAARRSFVRLARMPSPALRWMGFFSMVAGVLLLYSVRRGQ